MAKKNYELIESVENLQPHEIEDYILKRATTIVANTQGESWDDPEEWMVDSVELAHAVYRMLNESKTKV